MRTRDDARVVPDAGPQRTDRELELPVASLDLERDFVGRSGAERAQDRELEIVGSFVREIVPRAYSAEDERRDALEALTRRDGETIRSLT